ncbi:MAG: large conductance mechanosensitive channel protein MscL [Oscillospiraceae bacterium]|nr:large conductance mechanosensitive channel protein MscL [Oscillospiraceae bacterium]
MAHSTPGEAVLRHQKRFWGEFKAFVAKGNVISLAVGVVLGGAFQQIVNALVNSVILPIVGFFIKKIDFAQAHWDLTSAFGLGDRYNTLEEAQAAGHVVVGYGALLTAVMNFFVIAFVVFMLVRSLNRAGKLGKRLRPKRENAPTPPVTKKCPYCISEIPVKATRCAFCTSALQEQEGA